MGLSAVRLGVQRIAQTVTEQVEADDDDHDQERRQEEEREVGVRVVDRVGQDVAEGGRRGLDADTEVAQRRLRRHERRHHQREVDQQRGPEVRQDLLEVDPVARGAEEPGRVHELALADREHLAAHDAGDAGPAEQSEHQDDVDRVGDVTSRERAACR